MSETENDLAGASNGRPTSDAVRALVADDDPAIRLVLRHRLEAEGWQVEEAADSSAALDALRSGRFKVALLDIIMPGAGGLEVLSAARAEGCPTPIVVITAQTTMNNAVEALKRGAHDYLTKPFDNLDLVAATAARAVETAAQAGNLERLRGAGVRKQAPGEIIGHSPAMQEVYKLIGRMVNNDATVLLIGESGTGKELVARAIHFKSARGRAPFVAVNCSAIPHGLIESELFGHERGAFTGAAERRAGKFELAGAGTLFLDEIGDLPLELQPKLLRVLQEREFARVGGFETQRLQARIIAATNQDLEAAVAARRFREDLYFRLRVIPIHLPPLRERREDIPELTNYFVDKAAREMGARATAVSSAARARLSAYEWPGNVRELENTVLRAALLAPGNTIRAEDIVFARAGAAGAAIAPGAAADDGSFAELIARRVAHYLDRGGGPSDPRGLYQKLVGEIERPLIEQAMRRAQGNQVRAARILGLNRNTLRKKLVDLGIAPRKTFE
ncbi:MAG TPA: sigma-54 dependent transcriptional regulator [Candidatus Binataceae bacterium]|nr:sigma-54 dependent transcriptional regulator [Candidatus Binataceae bacterium]